MSTTLRTHTTNSSDDAEPHTHTHKDKHHVGGTHQHMENAPPLRPQVTPGGHPVDTSQPGFPVYHRKFADPAPLGLFSFGIATFVNSMYVLNVREIGNPNVMVALALFVGGLNAVLAGMWEMVSGNTFAATTFSCYGAFYLCFAINLLPASGVLAAYVYDPETSLPYANPLVLLAAYGEAGNAIAIWLFSFMILSAIFFGASFRSNVFLCVMFFAVTMQFLFQAIGYMNYANHIATGASKWFHVGGWFGILTAFCAYYVAFAALIKDPATTYFRIPVFQLSKAPGYELPQH